MSNDDLVKLTEIKLYFLEPPVSFRLNSYAVEKLKESLLVLSKYPLRNAHVPNFLNLLKNRIENNELPGNELRKELLKAGRMIGDLNNK